MGRTTIVDNKKAIAKSRLKNAAVQVKRIHPAMTQQSRQSFRFNGMFRVLRLAFIFFDRRVALYEGYEESGNQE